MTPSKASIPQLELLARAVEHVTDIVEISDPEARYLYVNKAFERVTGYTAAEVLGKTPAEVLRGADAHPPSYYDAIWQALTRGQPWQGRLVSNARDGRAIPQELSVSPVLDGEGQVCAIIAIKRDVTEREALVGRLVQADRLAAIGQLASGVAHEVNNPLAYVGANLELLRERLSKLEGSLPAEVAKELQELTTDASQGVRRVARVISDLSTFSTDHAGAAQAVDVHAVIESATRLVGHQLRPRAELVRDYGEVPRALGNAAWLSQVLVNLLMNSAQSGPRGGAEGGPQGGVQSGAESGAQGGAAEATTNRITVATRALAGEVCIMVSDRGEGIPSELLGRIFDPFFTTREIGAGSGMGLPVARNLVTRMGGTLEIDSRVGQGTTATIRLPSAGGVSSARPATSSSQLRAQTPPRVLIVDDELNLTRALRRVLAGYPVSVCHNGREALALLEREDFDIVFCDLMMPAMSGMQLYAAITERAAEYRDRFVFLTGGACTSEAKVFLQTTTSRVLQKPFELEGIRTIVSELTR